MAHYHIIAYNVIVIVIWFGIPVLAICSMFILRVCLQVPALVYNVAYGIAKETIRTSISWEILSIIRNFMVNVNSAVNFILYCVFGQNFRKVFVRMFCKKSLRVTETRGSSDRRTLTTNNASLSTQIPMLDRNSNSKPLDNGLDVAGDLRV